MPAGQVMIERRDTILKSVDVFLKIHNAWEADVHGDKQPSDKFETAIKLCIEICQRGDIPEECKRLISAVAKMGEEWLLYENGKMDSEYRPLSAFWDSVRNVISERAGAIPYAPRVRESVARLIKEGVSRRQIARDLYGDPEWSNGFGPFCGARGEVNDAAIDEEERLNKLSPPQTTLPVDWVHPDDRNRKRTTDEEMHTRLSSLATMTQKKKSKEDPEKMLREGAFIQQVANECGLTRDEVIAIANRLEITAEEVPNLAAMRAPSEPQIHERANASLQPGSQIDDEPRITEPDPADVAMMQAADLEAEGFTPEQIGEKMGLSPRKVKKLLMMARV